MLSVLIPTYNYNTFSLVKEIHSQLTHTSIAFEIICLDDASDQNYFQDNSKINALEFSNFQILKQNIGRSSIRNKLADLAKYDWLLFLDADVIPQKENFIKTYVDAILEEGEVICGGICYKNKKPIGSNLLRWTYGKEREEVSVLKRINKPYKHFLSANFLISKKQFIKIKFNETLTTYGHEDTLFAIELNKNRVKINHIENRVYHLGIESNLIFLNKVKSAIKNVNYLYNQKLISKNDIHLLSIFLSLKSLKVVGLMAFVFRKRQKQWERNLLSSNPSLFIFDIYKLGFLCSLKSIFK